MSCYVPGNCTYRSFGCYPLFFNVHPFLDSVKHSFFSFFKKMGQSRPLIRLFSVFSNKYHYNFYNRYMWKNVHPVYGAGIQTHDLRNVSLFPLPLDQGSRPCKTFLTFSLGKILLQHLAVLTALLNLSHPLQLESSFA